MKTGNIFCTDDISDFKEEMFLGLYKNENCLVEKIISAGQSTEEGIWLEEDKDEFVLLLQGESELAFEEGERVKLSKGDFILIPAGKKHRVKFTSAEPKCIWLAIHITK
ncbi:MAG: cupin domain-containing protein [Ignavibacteriae bacterium]|nr:cupin domain-containing protein [Ignavibacteriota bacterium]